MRYFCTVVTKSRLRDAIALWQLLRRSGNNETLYVMVADDVDGFNLPGNEKGLEFQGLGKIRGRIPDLMPFYFDPFEFCNALKPFVVADLFDRGASKIIYLDSDVLPFNRFEVIWNELESCDLLLSPHQLSPPPLEIKYTNEVNVCDMGIFNGGFLAWKAGVNSQKMIAWMCERFPVYGFNERAKGMFVDQKLLPLLTVYFPEMVRICRHPGVNVAYWNLHERDVKKNDDGFSARGEALLFFHLSGFRTSNPNILCSYLSADDNRRIFNEHPWLNSLLEMYVEVYLGVNCCDESSCARYAFDSYDGSLLNSKLRKILFLRGQIDRGSREVRNAIVLEFIRRIKRTFSRLCR